MPYKLILDSSNIIYRWASLAATRILVYSAERFEEEVFYELGNR